MEVNLFLGLRGKFENNIFVFLEYSALLLLPIINTPPTPYYCIIISSLKCLIQIFHRIITNFVYKPNFEFTQYDGTSIKSLAGYFTE
jgi:hypothetical protein